MDIEKLKRAADILGEEFRESPHDAGIGQIYSEKLERWTWFGPHQEEGAHWLKKMELKLDRKKRSEYETSMSIHFSSIRTEEGFLWCEFSFWFKTAPTKLCFEKIMEVI